MLAVKNKPSSREISEQIANCQRSSTFLLHTVQSKCSSTNLEPAVSSNAKINLGQFCTWCRYQWMISSFSSAVYVYWVQNYRILVLSEWMSGSLSVLTYVWRIWRWWKSLPLSTSHHQCHSLHGFLRSLTLCLLLHIWADTFGDSVDGWEPARTDNEKVLTSASLVANGWVRFMPPCHCAYQHALNQWLYLAEGKWLGCRAGVAHWKWRVDLEISAWIACKRLLKNFFLEMHRLIEMRNMGKTERCCQYVAIDKRFEPSSGQRTHQCLLQNDNI